MRFLLGSAHVSPSPTSDPVDTYGWGGVNMNKNFLYYVAKVSFFSPGVNMNKLFSKIFYYVAKKEFFFVGGLTPPLPKNTYG